MTRAHIIGKLPKYAEDLKKNLTDIFKNDQEGLTPEQCYGVALTACFILKHEKLLNAVRDEAKMFLEPEHIQAAKIAAMTMAIYNTYYDFTHTAKNEEIEKLPIDLSMNALHEHGINKIDFEVNLLAASIVNKCDYCIKFHADKLSSKGISAIALRNIGRIVSVMKSTAQVLEQEKLRLYDFMAGEPSW